ncbi:DUF4190 domain-containing protein [Herbiconiux sp. VKM Ac-2851]|uniref:DUF4190 domain-containing protein n=1 Tax=Herbiconiux sp. VKM Ac-2851 TaxID=2739025 RepID=UPI001C201601|nr:DUF4190 domain-containing protein [Herbiconiux sp. VKM Ac-2851]
MTTSTSTPDQTTSTQTTAVIPLDEAETTGSGATGSGAPAYSAAAGGYAGAGPATGNGAPAFPGQPVAVQPASVLPAQARTNVLGIITLVLGVLGFGLVPVITGHIALNQIKRTGEDGRGLTLAGLILGYVTLAGWLLVAFFWVAVAGLAVIGAAAGSGYGYGY